MRPTLIEQTEKKFKRLRGVGMILASIAIFIAFISNLVMGDNLGPSNGVMFASIVIGVVGLGFWCYGMVLSWWFHG